MKHKLSHQSICSSMPKPKRVKRTWLDEIGPVERYPRAGSYIPADLSDVSLSTIPSPIGSRLINREDSFACALCPSSKVQGQQVWNVWEERTKRIITSHKHCIENLPEVTISTADGFAGWAVILDSHRFRRRFNLVIVSPVFVDLVQFLPVT
jgi:hypothetical protein